MCPEGSNEVSDVDDLAGALEVLVIDVRNLVFGWDDIGYDLQVKTSVQNAGRAIASRDIESIKVATRELTEHKEYLSAERVRTLKS